MTRRWASPAGREPSRIDRYSRHTPPIEVQPPSARVLGLGRPCGARTASGSWKACRCRSLPLRGFDQNRTCCRLVAIVTALITWTGMIGDPTNPARRWEPRRFRPRPFGIPSAIACSGRRTTRCRPEKMFQPADSRHATMVTVEVREQPPARPASLLERCWRQVEIWLPTRPTTEVIARRRYEPWALRSTSMRT